MADYYRTAIESGLREYAKVIGENHSDQFYKDMGWYGLLDTDAWGKKYKDTNYAAIEKACITNANTNYEKSKKNECK